MAVRANPVLALQIPAVSAWQIAKVALLWLLCGPLAVTRTVGAQTAGTSPSTGNGQTTISNSHGGDTSQLPGPDHVPYTLHVYEDLVQLPVLVLGKKDRPYAGLGSSGFTLQLDSGPPFHPRHTRLQGDDPLQITLVFDVSRPQTLALARALIKPSAAPWTLPLHPVDSVSVYALNCHLIRSAHDLPFATDDLSPWLRNALEADDLHRHEPSAACGPNRRLWHTLAFTISQMRQGHGLRVIIVLSDGSDKTRSPSWNTVAHYASSENTTVIALRPPSSEYLLGDAANRASASSFFAAEIDPANKIPRSDEAEDQLALLCARTGGLVLPVKPENLAVQLATAIDLLRSRYILEFARPLSGTPGLHRLDVSISDRQALVLPAGVSFPGHDPARDLDPATVPTDPSRVPQVGDRRPITQPE